MATALAKGWIRAGISSSSMMIASDVYAPAREQFEKEIGGRVCENNGQVVSESDVIVLAVKPQQCRAVLSEICRDVTDRHLVVSIAAGIPLRVIAEMLGATQRLVRVMPNTPCLVGESASAFCLGGTASAKDAETMHTLLSAVGLAVQLNENYLDAVTGLSGSGPAYVCLMIEAMADGGVKAGLPRDIAQKLAAQTLLGTAKMVLETGAHPGVLKDAVASPAGTTIEGLHELERGGLRGTLMSAVEAAARRSRELGKD